MRTIYLDNAATSFPKPEGVELPRKGDGALFVPGEDLGKGEEDEQEGTDDQNEGKAEEKEEGQKEPKTAENERGDDQKGDEGATSNENDGLAPRLSPGGKERLEGRDGPLTGLFRADRALFFGHGWLLSLDEVAVAHEHRDDDFPEGGRAF